MGEGRLKQETIDASLIHRVVWPRVASDRPVPGLLVLHGRGADEGDLLGLATELDPRLLIVSARAPFPLGPGFHWYDLLAIGRPEPASFGRSRDLLGRFLGEIVEGYGIDPERLFLLGFSQGAMMSGTLLLTRSEAVAGAVLLSGYLPLHAGLAIDPASVRAKPVFVRHGVRDDVIPAAFGRESRDFLASAGAALDYGEYPIGHQISDQEVRDVAGWLTALLDDAPEAVTGAGARSLAGGTRGTSASEDVRESSGPELR